MLLHNKTPGFVNNLLPKMSKSLCKRYAKWH